MQINLDCNPIDHEAIGFIQDLVGTQTAFVPISGGKDSDVAAHLVKRSGVKYELHYHRTGLDAPETIRHIREHYPECIWDIPKKTFWQGMLSLGLPLRKQRWCCAMLKECFGHNRLVIQGVRYHESNQRKSRNCFEASKDDPTKIFIHPIFTWSTQDVWNYIDEYQIPHNPLYYTNGKRVPKRRVGCILCPSNTQYECRRQMKMFPGFVNLYKTYTDRYVQVRKDRGTPLTQQTGKEYFDWWISNY